MRYLLSHSVELAAQRSPDHVAFEVPGQAQTYGALDQQSNQLARLLVDQGVQPGDRVGIWMPRCFETATAVYGISKSGAAYVPIDPHAPPAGVARILESCGIRRLVARQKAAGAIQGLTELVELEAVIGCDDPLEGAVRAVPWSSIDEQPDAPLSVSRTSEDVAYIIFSSGSTGRPKGIAHTHRSGLSYAAMSAQVYDFRPEDRLGNLAPLHFDQSTLGYLTAPYAGSTTVIVPEAYTRVPASLSQLMEKHALTIWHSVPLAMIQLLLRGVLESRNLDSLRWVLYGGEPFPTGHLRALMKQWPQARFSNVYGPAEVNQCTFYHLPPVGEQFDDGASVPIGKVWDNAEGLVVDEHDQVVPEGEQGELLIRSATMMRGYWDRPDLNERAFHRRPSPTGDPDVFYRTGDLVRARADGNLDFLGRKDRQLKVRGYRVELDDIEQALTNHDAVEEAAAFPVRLDAGDLIEAAVTVREGAHLDTDELKSMLAGVLSWYAVPTRIETVESLPRTGTGKIDRRLLQTQAEERAKEKVLT